MARLSPAIRMALVIAALAGALGTAAYATGLFERLELAGVDSLFKVRADPTKADDVVLVAVDERSMDELNEQWPLRRRHHARVIDRLGKAGARAIAYDIQFTEPAPKRYDDDKLADSIYAARKIPVVLATAELTDDGDVGHHRVFGGEAATNALHATVGHATQLSDSDGVIRRYRLVPEAVEAFSAATAREALGGAPLEVPKEGWIDFAGHPGSVVTHSFSQVERGHFPANAFKDKIVVVGVTLPTEHDLHWTATSDGSRMSGPELQANAIQTLMRGAPLRDAPGFVNIAFILLAALAGALGLVVPRRGWFGVVIGVAVPILLFAAVVGAIILAFARGTVLPVTYSAGAFSLSLMLTSALLLSYERHARARQRLRDTFARFVPEQAVDELLQASGGVRALRGVEREATVMFADLRGFTARSQSESAQDIIEFLNRYLAEMSDAIMAHGGTVVSYMGDGVMAVFGAPLPQDDHAQRALAAAREMAGERLERFNAWLTAEGGEPVGLSIGLHSGPVASGTVGSERRLEYAAVGHTTNVAARLEALTRELGVDVLVSETTRALLAAEANLHPVGAYDVKGVSRPVFVYALDERHEADGSSPGTFEQTVRPAPDEHQLVLDGQDEPPAPAELVGQGPRDAAL
jgi:adenylate cyclase